VLSPNCEFAGSGCQHRTVITTRDYKQKTRDLKQMRGKKKKNESCETKHRKNELKGRS
jgi:hypothetical protein